MIAERERASNLIHQLAGGRSFLGSLLTTMS
jgi:hypothetical protein